MLEAAFTTGPTFFPFLSHRRSGRFLCGGGELQARRRTAQSGGTDESLAERFRYILPVPIGIALALDTTQRPRHGCEALWTDRRFTLNEIGRASSRGRASTS